MEEIKMLHLINSIVLGLGILMDVMTVSDLLMLF